MVIVLFRSRFTGEAGQDYAQMAREMVETARGMPGFIDVKSFHAEDGERLTVVWWQDEATMQQWREHPRHRIAQRLGREKWYSEFTVEVAEVTRTAKFRAADRS